ncbi:hypothetical protein HNY73_017632 [Argiope bruennichi]|uniref:Tubuliform egg casing silk strands structural domain-containing protein n=1 Tax=Argiope bruennichi TaxID=94029 RepID=A0A8T0EBA5_ARGBR|nr:hypothetical protein HNY73_017632 [Argiope bruennichi]
MSFPLRIAVAFIFTLYRLAAGAEFCIWCDKKTQNDFLACFSEKIKMNRELNIEPFLLEAMVKSLPAASNVINTPNKVKNTMMNGALSGEVVALITSISSPGRNRDIIVANIIRPLEECYATISGKSGTKFAASIGKTVMDTILDVDSDSDNNEYSLGPESSFTSNKDYPKPPPIIENSPSPSNSPNQAFSAVQLPRNFESAQQTPLRPLQPPAGSTALHSFQQNHEFTPNIRKNIDNGEPIQGQNFFQPPSYVSASVPQNGDNYASFPKQDFPASGSYVSAGVNGPQNGDNYAPFQNQKFSAPGSYASNNANMPQNGDNRAQYQNQDFPASGSYASADMRKNGDNYASFQKQDFVAPNSFAAANSKVGQNEENYTPNNNGPPFLGRNNRLISHSSLIPPKPVELTPNIPQLNQSPLMPSPAVRSDSKGLYYNDGINSKNQPINPLIFSPADGNVNRNPVESNVASSSSPPAEKNNYVFENYPNNAYNGGNVGPNGYYNDYGNNRWIPNGQPSYGLIPDYDYNPINSQDSGINSGENQPQTTQSSADTFPLQGNLSPNFQPLNDQTEYLNSDDRLAVPTSLTVSNLKDRDSGVWPAKSNEDKFSLQKAPKQENNNQPEGPSPFVAPQSDGKDFGTWEPNEADKETPALLQDGFNGESQNNSNRQMDTPADSTQNGSNSKETSTQTTTVATTQVPTIPATTKAPATAKPDVLQDKTCALEFAEANFIHLSESDSFRCVFNEDTPHDQAVSVAANAAQNAFREADLSNYAYKSKRICIREVSRLSAGATSQDYAEKLSKCTTIVVYKNGLLKKNCKAAGKFMAEQILNAISYITDATDTDNNEQNNKPYGNNNPFQTDYVPNTDSSNFAAPESLSASSDSENSKNYNAPQSNNAKTLISVTTVSEDSEGEIPKNYNGPQLDNIQNKSSTDSLNASQVPKDGVPISNHPLRKLPKSWNNKKSRGRHPSTSDNNGPDDANSSNNAETPASPQNSYIRNPNYYNSPQPDNAPDTASSAIATMPQGSNIGSPGNYDDVPQSNNAPSSASAAAYEGSEGEAPDEYNGPQSDSSPAVSPTDSLAVSQVPNDGAPISNYPLRELLRRWNNKESRVEHPSISDNNAPDDATNGNDAKTPVSPQNSYVRNPNYYKAPQAFNAPDAVPSDTAIVPQGSNTGSSGNYDNVPQSNNAPSSASAAAYEGSEGEVPDEYNGSQSDSSPAVSPTDSLAASQVPNDGAPISNYPLRKMLRRWNNKKSRGEHPSISDNNAPDDATNGNDAKTPVSPQNSYVRNPNYYKAPQAFNAPDAVPSDTAIVPQGSNSGSPNNYDNVLQTNNGPSSASAAAFKDSEGGPNNYNGPQIGSAPDLGSSDVPKQEVPVSKHPLREHPKPWLNKKNQGKHPSISDNNAPNDATSGNDAETPISPQNSYVLNPNYYNAPQSENAPDTISSAIAAVPQDSNTGIPNNYDNIPQTSNVPSSVSGVTSETSDGGVPDNGSQSDSPPDAASADSLGESQVPKEGAPVSNPPLRGLSRLWKNKKQRGRYPNTSDSNTQNDANNGNNGETPVSPQNSYVRNPNYYNAPDGVPSATATAPQGAKSGSPNNYDNNGPNIPISDEQPSIERNVNKYSNLNSKKNPLLNKLTDSDSRNHIDYLMKAALNCVSPSGFNYKAFTLGMASVATAMRKQHPNESPEAIINKTYLAAIVALIEDFQNAVFNRQESEGTQPLQNSQPLSRPNSESAAYRPSTNQQNSGASIVSQPLSRPNYESIEYRPSTNQQNSGASIVSRPPSGPNYESIEYRPLTNQQNSGASIVSQPPSRPNYESVEYRPLTNQQNSGASIVSQPPSRPNYESIEYRPSINQQNSGASVESVVNSNLAPISYQNDGNYQDTFQAVSLKENPQQTYANPSLQSVGQNSWAITNRNTLLNASPRERPQSFNYNQAGGFAYAAAG